MEKAGRGGPGFPARRSQFRPGIYPINFCSVEWQRARQFGSAFAILTLQNSAGHEEAARVSTLLADPTAIIIVGYPEFSHPLSRNHPRRARPAPLRRSAFVRQIFRRLLVRVYPITWPNTLPPEFLRPSFHRRVSFRPVNCDPNQSATPPREY